MRPAGATRCSAIAATRLSQTANGAPGSPCVKTSATSASTAGRRPNRRWTASVTISTKKKLKSVQRDVQVPGTLSTPVAARRLQPGGTWSVACSASTPVVQPTAGMAPASAMRESASSCSADRRSSTPAAFVSGRAVTSWSCPSTAIRPSVPGGRRSRRVVARSVPAKRSRTLAARPSGSSHSSRARLSASGGGSASPRLTSARLRLAPGSTRNAGSVRHSSGSSVREGSIAEGPLSSTCRSDSSAANTQTSRGGQGSTGGPFGSAIAFGRPSTRASTLTE